jgi:hypothetical protein
MICEIQMHTAGHYALKGEQHTCYELCRSVGLVGDIEGFDRNGTIANNGALQHQKPRLVTTVGIAFLRCWFAISLAIIAGLHASLAALEFQGEKEGWVPHWQGLSLAVPCWLLASMFAVDLWDTSRVAFAGLLFNIALVLVVWYLLEPAVFWYHADMTGLALCFFVLVFAVLLRRQLRRRGPEERKFPRIALLYSLYFGVDGTHFAWKSAIQQCFTVEFQAYVKLTLVGTIVSGPVSMAVYWTLIAVLVGNSVIPPLLLSSSVPWVRREGAMAFDVACDLVYSVGIKWFYLLHAFDVVAIVPVGIVAYISFISPCLRILFVVRTLEKTSWAMSGNVDPPRLSRKAAMGFGLLSLAGFGLGLVAADRDVYPWNADVCRPCQCSDELILERCDYEGQSLVLSRRGITGIKAGALDGAPNVKRLDLVHNDFIMLPSSAFDGAPHLERISMGRNKVAFLEAGALYNLTKLKDLWLSFNLLSSLDDFNGALNDLPSLDHLFVGGNDVTCEDLHFGTETWECSD